MTVKQVWTGLALAECLVETTCSDEPTSLLANVANGLNRFSEQPDIYLPSGDSESPLIAAPLLPMDRTSRIERALQLTDRLMARLLTQSWQCHRAVISCDVALPGTEQAIPELLNLGTEQVTDHRDAVGSLDAISQWQSNAKPGDRCLWIGIHPGCTLTSALDDARLLATADAPDGRVPADVIGALLIEKTTSNQAVVWQGDSVAPNVNPMDEPELVAEVLASTLNAPPKVCLDALPNDAMGILERQRWQQALPTLGYDEQAPFWAQPTRDSVSLSSALGDTGLMSLLLSWLWLQQSPEGGVALAADMISRWQVGSYSEPN